MFALALKLLREEGMRQKLSEPRSRCLWVLVGNGLGLLHRRLNQTEWKALQSD